MVCTGDSGKKTKPFTARNSKPHSRPRWRTMNSRSNWSAGRIINCQRAAERHAAMFSRKPDDLAAFTSRAGGSRER